LVQSMPTYMCANFELINGAHRSLESCSQFSNIIRCFCSRTSELHIKLSFHRGMSFPLFVFGAYLSTFIIDRRATHALIANAWKTMARRS
jgi:hypothetical protein